MSRRLRLWLLVFLCAGLARAQDAVSIIPAAQNLSGPNGAHYATDLDVSNTGSSAANVTLELIGPVHLHGMPTPRPSG